MNENSKDEWNQGVQGLVDNLNHNVDKDIEFDIPIYDRNLTCGWLLEQATRRYCLLKIKGKRKRIVALKTSD